jgi:Tfp pilus assembly protein PilW
MELPNTSSRKSKARVFGNSVPEYMIAVAVGSLIGVFAITVVVHSGRTFASLANYADMNASGIATIDRLSREIRSAAGLSFFDQHRIILKSGTNRPSITYAYSVADKTLSRQEGTQPATVLLTECDSLDFFIYEPTVASNSLSMPVTTAITNARAVGVNWVCSRSILGRKVNNDSPRTAVIVMRKP